MGSELEKRLLAVLQHAQARHDAIKARHQGMMLAFPTRVIKKAMHSVFQHVGCTTILLHGEAPHRVGKVVIDVGGNFRA